MDRTNVRDVLEGGEVGTKGIFSGMGDSGLEGLE